MVQDCRTSRKAKCPIVLSQTPTEVNIVASDSERRVEAADSF
jgi:hypothetical protein